MQAEVSILDEQRHHAYTIVGNSVRASVWNTAYLAFRAPTPNTYLETAFFNPQGEEVRVDLEVLAGAGWEAVESFSLRPLEMRKLRVPAAKLAASRNSADRTVLFRATYSVSVTELVTNAWLEDETTGFSNTVLFHEARPESNRLYGAQLVAYGYPRDILPDGPSFEGHLVLANIDQEVKMVTPTLYCELGGEQATHTLPAFELEPETVRSLSLNQILADQIGLAAEAVCSAEIEFTGAPGTLVGRYFGESSTLTYGLYSKLEAGLGHAYNELYWNVEGDRTPLLTVTNFSDTTERLDIWATRDAGSKILRTVELPAKASVHINMQQEFTQRGSELEALKSRNFGGFFIRAQSPTAKVLVKEHIFSLSRQVASPYYGSPDIIYSHEIFGQPNWMTAGGGSSVSTVTCYMSGCYFNEWPVQSMNPSIVSVLWPPGFWLNAHQPGNATLYSNASGPMDNYGNWTTINDSVGINVYDSTPVINAIVPNTIPTSGSQIAEIYGINFGSNPTVSATGGIQVTRLYHSPTQINVRFDAPATPLGSYNVMVTSNGLTGVFLQAPGGGSQAQSASKPANVVCAVPTGEGVEAQGWAVDVASYGSSVHKFVQHLVPSPTSQPTSVSFAGRTVTETAGQAGVDNCYVAGLGLLPFENVTGHTWTIGNDNAWGPDYVGWQIQFFGLLQLERRAQGLPFPCDFKVYQKLTISSCGGGSSSTVYRNNVLLRGIIWNSQVGAERSGVLRTQHLYIQ